MNRFKDIICSLPSTPDTIVHIGAGSCKEYSLYSSLQAERVIFVEPDGYLASKARKQYGAVSNVTILECAISVKEGKQMLNVTNNRRFSSLLKPGDLLEYFPNIEIIEKIKVRVLTLESLCQHTKINNNEKRDRLLVAELQGLEESVFSAATVETLEKFKWIIIRSSEKNQYQTLPAKTQENLIDTMQNLGYTVLSFAENAPPFNTILCIRNKAKRENERVRLQNNDLVNTLRVLEHNFSKTITKLDVLKARTKKRMEKAKKVIRKNSKEAAKALLQVQVISGEKAALQQKTKELMGVVETKVEELTQAQGETQSLATEKAALQQKTEGLAEVVKTKAEELIQTHGETQTLAAEKAALQQKMEELTGIVETKVEELTQAQGETQTLATEKSALQQQTDELTELLNKKSDESDEMQQTVRINNKLLLKTDADMRDLQIKYRTALEYQDKQYALLTELKEKLRQASVYYQKLSLQNLVIDEEVLKNIDATSTESGSEDSGF